MIHIVTPFPTLLFYSFFAPTLLRIILGLFAIALAVAKQKSNDVSSDIPQNQTKKYVDYGIRILFFIAGFLSIVGLYTQIAMLVLIVLFVIGLIKQEWIFQRQVSRSEIILILVIALSLLISGAGAFAIDYPL